MGVMLKVKLPSRKKGWAMLALSDFAKPRPDGTKWELYEEPETTEPATIIEPAKTGRRRREKDR